MFTGWSKSLELTNTKGLDKGAPRLSHTGSGVPAPSHSGNGHLTSVGSCAQCSVTNERVYNDSTEMINHMIAVSVIAAFTAVCFILHGDS